MMGDVFDEVWATVASTFANHKPGEIELARATLARRIASVTAAAAVRQALAEIEAHAFDAATLREDQRNRPN